MTPLEQWGDAAVSRLIKDVLATSLHRDKSRAELIAEMETADAVMHDMSLENERLTRKVEDLNDALDRVLIYRKMLFVMLCVAVLAAVLGWLR